MADESANPFAQAMRGERYPQFIEEGTAMGAVTNIGNLLWGKPLATRQAEFEARERAFRHKEAQGIAAGERQAIADLVGVVNEAKAAAPNAPSHVLMKTIVADPRFVKNALRVPAPKMTQFIGTLLEGMAAPLPQKGTVLGEGAIMVDPVTGQPRGPGNPKPPASSELDKETAKAVAKQTVGQWDAVVEEGRKAQMDSIALDELDSLIGTADKEGSVTTGLGAAARGYLGRIGIAVPGTDDVQALESLIDRLTPAQRAPGSGSSSDFDARMFRSALPNLIRTPAGNQRIAKTLRAMNDYRKQQAEIANRVFSDGDDALTVRQAMKEIGKLKGPMADFNSSDATPSATPKSSFDDRPTIEKAKRLRFNPETGQLEPVR